MQESNDASAAAPVDAAVAGKKRKRVTIDEGANTEEGGSRAQRPRGEGEGAGAAKVKEFSLSSHTATGKPKAEDRRRFEVDDDEDDEGDVIEAKVGGKKGKAIDDSDDEGSLEDVDAPGANFGERGVGKSGKKAADDEDDDEEDAPSKSKGGAALLKHVKGEQSKLTEEFNEAGDAFEPFNLRREREEGYFDEGGNYVWKKKKGRGKKGGEAGAGSDDDDDGGGSDGSDDDEEGEDAWLDGLDEMDPRERAKLQQQAAARIKATSVNKVPSGGSKGAGAGKKGLKGSEDEDDDDNDDDEAGLAVLPPSKKVELLLTLRELLSDDGKETVADALRRYSGRSGSGSGGAAATSTTKDMASFDRVTEAADTLMRSGGDEGTTNIYSWKRKEVVWRLEDACEEASLDPVTVVRGYDERRMREKQQQGQQQQGAAAATATSSSSSSSSLPTDATTAVPAALAGKSWEYRWTEPPLPTSGEAEVEEGVVFGPFTTAELLAWKAAGYFGPASGRTIYLRELISSSSLSSEPTTAASAPPASSDSAGAAKMAQDDNNDDSDDDIFSGAGGYDVKKVAAAASTTTATSTTKKGPWKRYDEAGF
jgi:GYF domain